MWANLSSTSDMRSCSVSILWILLLGVSVLGVSGKSVFRQIESRPANDNSINSKG